MKIIKQQVEEFDFDAFLKKEGITAYRFAQIAGVDANSYFYSIVKGKENTTEKTFNDLMEAYNKNKIKTNEE